MSYDANGLLSVEHDYQCPCGCKDNLYFSMRVHDKVMLRCGNCTRHFPVIDAERKIHRAITNADDVRSMSDEELAELFVNVCNERNNDVLASAWLDWLKSEKK